MIVKLRLEAEGKTLKEVTKNVADAVRQLGPAMDELHIHDEHYERIHASCFKGRVVLVQNPKPKITNKYQRSFQPQFAVTSSSNTTTSGGGR